MKKRKPLAKWYTKPSASARFEDRNWHNGGDAEMQRYAQSLRNAARRLIDGLDPKPDHQSAWDACPVITLYKQAIEIHMKLLIGDGRNFLPSPTESITLSKTHSLRWLAQIVCLIIKTVRWEAEFKCQGVANLAGFSEVVSRLERMDPVLCVSASQNRKPDASVPDPLQPAAVIPFAETLDALLDLLDSTADALAATRDEVHQGVSVKLTIH